MIDRNVNVAYPRNVRKKCVQHAREKKGGTGSRVSQRDNNANNFFFQCTSEGAPRARDRRDGK